MTSTPMRFNLPRDNMAAIAQLGERQTEDLKVPGSVPGLGILLIASRSEKIIRAQLCIFRGKQEQTKSGMSQIRRPGIEPGTI